jgi:hypothetical protein
MQSLDYWQGARYRSGMVSGHYESWFLRANHPSQKKAFWIRYTVFSPKGQPQSAMGELWAIYFDGEAGRIWAAKDELPIGDCQFSTAALDLRIGDAILTPGHLQGGISKRHQLDWNLTYREGGAPVFFLPFHLYDGPFPKAKALSQRPHVVFNGTLAVDGANIAIDGWVGSENHNWGSKHTDTYAWGQVVGFDNAPDAFLECATVKLKVGPFWTPPLTLIVLRLDGQEYRLNSIRQALRAQGAWQYFDWAFDSRDRHTGVRIHGRMHAAREDFVGLTYLNPPGGSHTCLNSKVASCELSLERPGMAPVQLSSQHSAAFEILTDDVHHGVELLVP